MARVCVRSGGQTGVDRAALDVAIQLGIPYAGWCPRGGWAEDWREAPGLLAHYPALTETPSPRPEQRTAWNVRDSHATLLLILGEQAASRSAGTQLTRLFAELVFLRPMLMVDLERPVAGPLVHDWIDQVRWAVGTGELLLNVAGPRESEAPGLYDAATTFLQQLLSR